MASFTGDRYKTALTCGICQEILTEPRALPCMHTYCLKCLDNLIQKSQLQGGSFNCPECRHVCTVPQKGAWEFKVSPTVSYLVDAFKDSQQVQKQECDPCLESHQKHTLAKIRCLDCNKRLCDTCHKTHDSLLKDHKILDLTGDNVQDFQMAIKSIKDRTVYCKQHPSKPVELYCTVDKTVLCHLCYPTKHAGHTCEDIKETAVKNMKPIGAVITQGKELVNMYEQAINDTQAYQSQLEQTATNITAEINNDMNTLIQAIRDKYKHYTEQVMKEKEGNIKQVISHLGHLELQKAILEGQINNYCTMLDHGHPVEIASLVEQVSRQSEEWSKQPKTTFSTKIDIKFIAGKCGDDGVEYGTVSTVKHEEVEEDTVKHEEEEKHTVVTALCEPTVTKNKLHENSICDLTVTPEGDFVATGGKGYNSTSTCIYNRNYKMKKDLNKEFYHVTLTNDGKLAFTDEFTNIISIYNTEGNHKRDLVCKGLSKLGGIAMNPAGDLLVIDGTTKKVYSVDQSTGEPSAALPGTFNGPFYLTCNSKQVNIISDHHGHCVKGIASDGTEVFTYGTYGSGDGQLHYPFGICADEGDYIFIADSNNHRVVLLTPEGKFLKDILTEDDGVCNPYAVAITNDGKLVVGDRKGNLFTIKYRE